MSTARFSQGQAGFLQTLKQAQSDNNALQAKLDARQAQVEQLTRDLRLTNDKLSEARAEIQDLDKTSVRDKQDIATLTDDVNAMRKQILFLNHYQEQQAETSRANLLRRERAANFHKNEGLAAVWNAEYDAQLKAEGERGKKSTTL